MDSTELPADTDGARKTALRAHAVVVKLKEMGLGPGVFWGSDPFDDDT